MEAEAAKHMKWILFLAEMLPRLQLHTLDVQALGTDTYRINVVVENTGYLPTFTSQQSKARQAVRSVRAELTLPEGVEILSGKRRVELGFLEGRSNKSDVATLYGFSPTDNRVRVEWVLRAPVGSSVKLEILSERAGSLHKEIKLGIE